MNKKLINTAMFLRKQIITIQNDPLKYQTATGKWYREFIYYPSHCHELGIYSSKEFSDLLIELKEYISSILKIENPKTNGIDEWVGVSFSNQESIVKDLDQFIDKYEFGKYLIEKRQDKFFYMDLPISGIKLNKNSYILFEILFEENKENPNQTVCYEKIYPKLNTKTKDEKKAVRNVLSELKSRLKVEDNKSYTKEIKELIMQVHGQGLWLDNRIQK